MNWIILSLIMFFSSIVYYLLIKVAQNKALDKNFYMLATYILPTGLFYLISVFNKYEILISISLILQIFVTSALVNYIGSVISYKGMQKAPNNGYSLVIQKSYAVVTSIAAIYVFNSPLSIKKFIAILFIIFCSFIISVQKGKKINIANYSWVIYSVVAMLCFSITTLFGKYFIGLGIKPTVYLFYVCFFTLILTLIEIIKNGSSFKFKLTLNNLLIFILIGVFFTSFSYFRRVAEVIAPNIGYVSAINGSSNAFYTVLLALIFKDHLSWKKFLAVLGVTIGVIILIT